MQRFTIVGLGEVLWDMFPDGARFGGAPANFACHAAMLGGDAYVVSQVGHDDLGARAIAALHGHGVHTDFVTSSPDRPTGTVQVTLDPQGKPAFAIGADAAWDALAWTDRMSELAGRADAVCFGTLGQRSPAARATIRQFLDAIRPDCLGIFDVNLRPPYYDGQLILDSLARANALKLNDDELPIVAGIAGVHGDDRAVLVGLRDRYDLRFVALTRGARGPPCSPAIARATSQRLPLR